MVEGVTVRWREYVWIDLQTTNLAGRMSAVITRAIKMLKVGARSNKKEKTNKQLNSEI